MKALYLFERPLGLFIALFLVNLSLYGQGTQGTEEGAEKNVINGYYDQAVFYDPVSKTPYIETYLSIDGRSLEYEPNEAGKPRSKVEVTVIVQKGDSIVDFDKTVNSGPASQDSGEVRNLIDVKRFPLKSGAYQIEAVLKDLNTDSVQEFAIRSEIGVPNYGMDSLLFSQVQLLESFERAEKQSVYTKSGMRLIPYVANYYPPKVKQLSFYVELYNTQKVLGDTGKFALRYYLYDRDRKKMMEDYHRIRIRGAQEVVPVMSKMNIEKLPTGNYDLVVEARSTENELISRRSTFIQRHGTQEVDEEELLSRQDDLDETFVKDMDHADSLRMYLRSLAPISDRVEEELITDQVEVMDLETMKRFMYGFWFERNRRDPGTEWRKYKALVDHVNREYSAAYKKGFQTDRGETVLKYGRPDQIVERKHKTHSYPYEIWQYYEIGKYSNKRFVFYNTDLATGDYDLLHSDMPGELRNRRWKRDLQDRQNVMDNVDQEGTFDHYGREVDDLFRNP